MRNFILEIGVEELPAWPLLKELNNISLKWEKLLNEYRLGSNFSFYYTPRRLVFLHEDMPNMQSSYEEELFGPPVVAAYKDGNPTPAALGFAKKCGVEVSQLEKSEKKGKEVLYFKKEVVGKAIEEVFEEVVDSFIKSLKFGKHMRWGSLEEDFIRPIKWIACILNDKVLDLTTYGISSSDKTFAHRNHSYEAEKITDLENYESFLESRGVILDPIRREEKILNQIKEIESKSGVSVQIDKDLLKEVVAITEFPTALLGEFDKEFLALPPEVIITSMKEHQRYFAVEKDGGLSNNFVCVANSLTDDFSLIKAGNEKVLRPRLKDGMFFWENDLKRTLVNDGLENLVFADELGSLADKVKREIEIGKTICELLKQDSKDVVRGIELSKADLLSEMVYEFTELQGVMGEYYAKAMGENEEVSKSIKEQYMPAGEDDDLPSTKTGSIVSMATKFDSLMALFSVGKVPTGSKDPLALRRAASGFVKIIIDNNFSIDLETLVEKLSHLYKDFDKKVLINFINERLFNIYSVNPSLITAVLKGEERELIKISKNIEAVSEVVKTDGFKDKFSTFKRVANIIKDLEIHQILKVDTILFKEDAEKALYEKYNSIGNIDGKELLNQLFDLKSELDKFFDDVMVNDKNEAIKRNRQNLIGSIYKRFLKVADIKEITI